MIDVTETTATTAKTAKTGGTAALQLEAFPAGPVASAPTIRSVISYGADGLPVEIECHLANSLPNIVIVGAATRTVDEAKERIRGAFNTAGLPLPRKRISINLAPADIPKDSSSLDLPIAISILNSSGALTHAPDAREAIVGELGLDGQVRPVRGIIGKLLCGRREGYRRFYIPAGNLQQAQIIPDIEIVPVERLQDLYGHFNGRSNLTCIATGKGILTPGDGPDRSGQYEVRLDDIIGQELAKRALVIAAAGGHNILLNGPPGTGKSMLAKSLISLLPQLSQEEILEVTHLHSLSGHDYEKLVTERPFRTPHHSASHVAVVGGGNAVRPGEVSLAHRGVLFFDEMPEFPRLTLEALRQPLEDKTITVSRARESITYPANFIFVATANPCPCGYNGTANTSGILCDCTLGAINGYRSKLSGPLLDRIDLAVSVDKVEHRSLLTDMTERNEDSSASTIRLVLQARRTQAYRYGNRHTLNSDMSNADIRRFAYPTPAAKETLDRAARHLHLSARSYMRCLRVARTIADLAGSTDVGPEHVSEAIQYRSQHALKR